MSADNQKLPGKEAILDLSDLPFIEKEVRFSAVVKSMERINRRFVLINLKNSIPGMNGKSVRLILPSLAKDVGVIDRSPAMCISEDVIVVALLDANYARHLSKLTSGSKVSVVEVPKMLEAANDKIIIADGLGFGAIYSSLDSAKQVVLVDNDGYFDNAGRILDDIMSRKGVKSFSLVNKLSREIYTLIDKNPNHCVVSGSVDFKNNLFKKIAKTSISNVEVIWPEWMPNNTSKVGEILEDFYNGARYKSKRSISEPNELLVSAIVNINNPVIITDENNYVIYVNQAACSQTGYASSELINHRYGLWGSAMGAEYYRWREFESCKDGSFNGLELLSRRSGVVYAALVSIADIDLGKNLHCQVRTERDISDLWRQDKMKSDFISIATHQLRTPLSTINWYSEMLVKGEVGELTAKQQHYIEEIYSANKHMTELMNSLLDAAKLDDGKSEGSKKLTDINTLVQAEINEQNMSISEKNISCKFEGAKSLPALLTEANGLRMIIQNLLSNAIKYTPNYGRVTITTLLSDARHIMLKVADTGCGIPKPQQTKIFGRLFRADNARTSGIEGTGLGLYIVKETVEKMGGKIYFESTEGKGTVFYVIVPINHI